MNQAQLLNLKRSLEAGSEEYKPPEIKSDFYHLYDQLSDDREERTVKCGSWNHDTDELECSARIASNPDRCKQGDPQIPKKSLVEYTFSVFRFSDCAAFRASITRRD